MNAFTNAILTILLGWLRSLFNVVWALVSGEGNSTLWQLLSLHWQAVFVVLCVGGFVVDRVIYLLRWRPFYVWRSRRHQRRMQKQHVSRTTRRAPSNADQYAPPPVYGTPAQTAVPMETYAERTTRYKPTAQQPASAGFAPAYRYTPPAESNVNAPTAAYAAIQPSAYAYAPADVDDAPPPYQPYPPDSSFAPTIAYAPVPYRAAVEPEPLSGEPRFDDDLSAWTSPRNAFSDFAPGAAPAATYAPSREQDERYLRDVAAGFAPPPAPEQLYTPRAAVHPGLDTETLQQNIGLTSQDISGVPRDNRNAYPSFAPFSTAQQPSQPLAKPRALDVLAKKARSFVDGIDEENPPTIRDLQSTVDVSSAFRAPVYPKRPPESEE